MNVRHAATGGLAGAVATAAMTGWMLAGQLTGTHGEQPPKRLVRRLSRRIGLPARRQGTGIRLASGLAHLGFGTSCGALYAAAVPRSTVPRGIIFALGVWAASYAGWIPALGLLPPPGRDNPRRAWTIGTAHAVYGAVLGGLLMVAERNVTEAPEDTPTETPTETPTGTASGSPNRTPSETHRPRH
jgi:hypothetical protein